MKKYLVLGLAVLSIANVSAKENTKQNGKIDYSPETLCHSAKEYGNIIFRTKGTVDGKEINYYCEFENTTEALNDLKGKFENSLNYLKEKYSLEPLNESNWESYYNAVNKDDNSEYYFDYQQIKVFFDTYENTDKNNKINNIVESLNFTTNKKNSNKNIQKQELLKELDLILPIYNEKMTNDEYIITPFADQRFNVTAGVNYAKTYAWNANRDKYGELGADCTNFASQILENGGYTQVWGLTNRFGWWYKNDNGFKYSWSWVNADSFLKYWGIKNYYYDFEQLSRNVQVGDFIVLDENDDGDYNHTGFVTYKSSSLSSHVIQNNIRLNYYDFIVAQHTNNYNSWVSEDVNGWENGVLTNSRYAIVNINK